MSEIKHTSLPWRLSYIQPGPICIGIQRGDTYGEMVCNTILPDTDEEYEKTKDDIEGNMKFIVEACNNYYKLKEQNEKLKEQIRQTEAWLSFNTHPDKDQIRVFRNSMIELLKSCESWNE